jgi:hypothetical protein
VTVKAQNLEDFNTLRVLKVEHRKCAQTVSGGVRVGKAQEG